MTSITDNLLCKHHIISSQIEKVELRILLQELEAILKTDIEGDVVEFGCYEGTSALFEMRMLKELASDKTLWLYDSFEGLPEKTQEDMSAAGEAFKAGELRASQSQLKRNFVKANLPLPEITKAWFFELDETDLPERICFAFLDGDFYDSIHDSLRLVWARMSRGGVIVIDDYFNAQLPGVKRAVHEFFDDKVVRIQNNQSLAIVRL